MVDSIVANLVQKGFRMTFDTTETGNIRLIISHPKVSSPGVFVGSENQIKSAVRDWLKSIVKGL